jgi:sugar phosphate permease
MLPAVFAQTAVTGIIWLSIALAGLELTVAVSWAICLDIAGEFSGSVSGVMNTFGNVGGAISSISIAYLATHFGWTWAFIAASLMCISAALLATRIDPSRMIGCTEIRTAQRSGY